MISVFGWLSAFGSFMFYQAHIDDLIAQNQELPKTKKPKIVKPRIVQNQKLQKQKNVVNT